MSQNVMPFFDSSEGATRHAIEASGKDPKDVAHALYPDKTVMAARTLLLNALNENRAERLTADQHIFIANFCSRFDWLYYVAHQCSHAQPQRVTPEAKAQHLQAALFAKADELSVVLRQIESLKVAHEAAA